MTSAPLRLRAVTVRTTGQAVPRMSHSGFARGCPAVEAVPRMTHSSFARGCPAVEAPQISRSGFAHGCPTGVDA